MSGDWRERNEFHPLLQYRNEPVAPVGGCPPDTLGERYGITACPRLGDACRWTVWYDPMGAVHWIQHGDNEEHRLAFNPRSWSDEHEREVVAWLNSIHEYERTDRP